MNDQSMFAAIMGFFALYFVVLFAVIIAIIVANWKIFTKAGEGGWKSIIPYYNMYILYKISWKTSFFWILLACLFGGGILSALGGFLTIIGFIVAIVGCVISVIQLHKLSKAFGHGVGFTIGLVFLNPIFLLILGFGSSQYLGPQM